MYIAVECKIEYNIYRFVFYFTFYSYIYIFLHYIYAITRTLYLPTCSVHIELLMMDTFDIRNT